MLCARRTIAHEIETMKKEPGPRPHYYGNYTADKNRTRSAKKIMEFLLIWLVGLVAVLVSLMVWLDIPAFLYTYYRQLRISKLLDNANIPSHWLWGNAPYVMDMKPEERFHLWTTRVQENRVKMSRFWVGPTMMMVVLVHPDPIRNILKEPKNMAVYRMLKPWIGDGLLVSEGKKWFRNRRLLTPAFHYEILKPYVQVSNSCLDIMLEQWQRSADKKEPVKVFDSVSFLTLDILLQCAFSYKSDCQRTRKSAPYVNAIYTLLLLAVNRFLNPIHHIDWIYWLTSSGREMRKQCNIVHKQSEKVIKERKKALGLEGEGADRDKALEVAKQQRKYLDFLDILLTAADEDGSGLTDLEIRDEADTFMFEGHDTTTSGISWTLYCLAKYPEHQEKIRDEVRNVLMGREWLEYDDLKELKYTHWCIKEAMRLYPPVLEIHRQLSKDTELNGIVIPKGTRVTVNMPSLHHHPDIWENPNEYDPLRFHPSNAEGRDPYAYFPFAAGHRNCIGQTFALNEERVVIATILNNFRISLVPDHRVVPTPLGVLKSTSDILLNLEPCT